MENLIVNFFFKNWERKAVALFTAIIVWLYVSHSITETKTVRSIPIRLINLPPDKTAIGLLSNGVLDKRVNLTLIGTKEVISEIEPGDLEIVLDASIAPTDDWVVHVTKKSLLSLNPSIDLLHSISSITHPEFVIKLSRLVKAKIPVSVIINPVGRAPKGYEYLDAWPQKLWHEMSGPAEEIHKLQSKGLLLQIDLNQVTKEELDAIKSAEESNEIYYSLPKRLKMVQIPFRGGLSEPINDPWANQLHLNFLRKEPLLLDKAIPVRLFIPTIVHEQLQPLDFHFLTEAPLAKEYGEILWKEPLYVQEVSKLFLQVVRNYIEITVEVSDNTPQLSWSFDIVNQKALEYRYIKKAMAALMAAEHHVEEEGPIKRQKELLRRRFREYCQKMRLYKTPTQPLMLTIRSNKGEISLNVE